MRTRSQGPVTNEDLYVDEPEIALPLSRGGDGQPRSKRKEGKSLSVDVEEASTRTSFEAPFPARESNVEARRLNNSTDKPASLDDKSSPRTSLEKTTHLNAMGSAAHELRKRRLRSPWTCSSLTLFISTLAFILALTVIHSFTTRQLDPKGCAMSYMRPSFAKFSDFDTEHTRFASKYSLYLYREGGIDDDTRVNYGGPDRVLETKLTRILGERYPGPIHTWERRELQAS